VTVPWQAKYIFVKIRLFLYVITIISSIIFLVCALRESPPFNTIYTYLSIPILCRHVYKKKILMGVNPPLCTCLILCIPLLLFFYYFSCFLRVWDFILFVGANHRGLRGRHTRMYSYCLCLTNVHHIKSLFSGIHFVILALILE
jgi:hypothetical protein